MQSLIDPKTDFAFNLNSNPQMQEFLFEFLKVKPFKEANAKGNYSVDEEVLTHYAEKENVKFCQLLLAYRKLEKAQNTYLNGIIRFLSHRDWYLHPEFWLNIASTYRSSSSDPNFQNIPVHEFIIPGIPWSIIRSIFVNKGPGWLLGGVDYEGAEAKAAAMLSDDPQLIEDLNSNRLIHSDWAIFLFGPVLKGLSHEEVKAKYKDTYYFLAKNNFTFATMFGATEKSVAEEMRKHDLYKDYITNIYRSMPRPMSFGVFFQQYSEDHIKRGQTEFYNRYKFLKQWQNLIVDFYYKNGYVKNPFGFRRRYPLKRNEIINMPIQSTSFLLLLDSAIQIEDYLIEEPMESHPIGQIHDELNSNVRNYEAGEYMEMVNYFMTEKPHLPWTQKVKMGTEWSFGLQWDKMHKIKNEYTIQ